MDESEFGEYAEGMTAQELLDWACKRMMGMQEDADGTSEIEADYAWLRDDEIYLECVEMFPFLAKQNDAKDVLETLLTDERWPVRVMANLTNFMLSVSEEPEHFSEYENRRLLGNWLDAYRAMDPDPTEP
tara:strand:- start:265 stop:654 length:390 start_codon:yes stop_codon:yes gene_type:complete